MILCNRYGTSTSKIKYLQLDPNLNNYFYDRVATNIAIRFIETVGRLWVYGWTRLLNKYLGTIDLLKKSSSRPQQHRVSYTADVVGKRLQRKRLKQLSVSGWRQSRSTASTFIGTTAVTTGLAAAVQRAVGNAHGPHWNQPDPPPIGQSRRRFH